VGRNLAPRPHAGVALDLDESTDFGFVSDPAAVKIDERRLRDSHILSQLDILQTHLFLTLNCDGFFVRASLIGAAPARHQSVAVMPMTLAAIPLTGQILAYITKPGLLGEGKAIVQDVSACEF
jgi:hypothetical protein